MTYIDIREVLEPRELDPVGLPGTVLHCPVCKGNTVHVAGKVLSGRTDDYTEWQGRGSVHQWPIECDGGHRFYICIGFHKGWSNIWVRQVLSPSEWIDDNNE
jgi:hypothetical protein